MTAVKRKFRTADLAYTALGAVLITVCSWLTVPATVPFTMQTFAVFLVLLLLGGLRGTVSVLVYIALGALGLPVFSGFRGGLAVLAGTTGGYIAGFVFAALFYWLVTAVLRGSVLSRIVGMAGGLIVCYAFGTAWFVVAYSSADGAVSVASALMWCVVPFIIPDVLKLVLAFSLGTLLSRRLHLG